MNQFEAMNEIEIERVFTSRIMFKPDDLHSIDGYNPQSFTNQLCMRVNMAINAVIESGKEVDTMSIVVYFKEQKWSTSEIYELLELPTAWLVGNMNQVYDAIRRNYYKQRACMELHNLAVMAKTAGIDEIITKTNGLVSEIESGITSTVETHDMQSLVVEAREYILERKQQRLDNKYYYWGLPDLDEKTGGFIDEYSFVVARPSVGKTAFINHIIEMNARQHPCLFFSLEMIRQQIICRFLSSRTGIQLQRIIKGFCSKDEMERLEEEYREVMKLKLIIHDQPSTFEQIKYVARREVKRNGIKIILLDFFSKILYHGDREHELSKISGQLKSLGQELRVPIIVASQSNDTKEEANKTREPKMGNIRYTDAASADGDVIMYMLPGVDFVVTKSRNGFTGTSSAVFTKECVRFETTPF